MSKRFLNYVLLTIIAVVSLKACAKDHSAAFEEKYVDGVRIRTYGKDTSPPAINPLSVAKGTVFGADQGENTYILSSVGMAGIADDGSIYLVDRRQRRLFRFHGNGELLGTFGQRGQGPGEFQSLGTTIIIKDVITIWDSRSYRLSRFNLDGLLLGTQTIETTSQIRMPDSLIPYELQGNLHYVTIRNFGRTELLGSPPCEATYEALYYIQILNEELKFVDTIVDTARTFRAYALGTSTRVYSPSPPKYAQVSPRISIRSGLPIAMSWGDEYRIDFYNLEDNSQWSVRIEKDQIPVTDKMRELEYDTWERRGLEEQARRYLPFADHLPLIGSLLWDSAGRLWVMDYVPTGRNPSEFSFNVFNTQGNWIFSQQLPVIPTTISESGFYSRISLDDGSPAVQYYEFIEN